MVEIDEIVVGDEPRAWAAAGFTVDPDGTCRIGHVPVRLGGSEAGRHIRGWALRGLEAAPAGDTVDGLTTTRGSHGPVEPGEHPNGALHIDHVVVLSPDLARTTAAFEALGLDVRRIRDTEADGAPARQVFFRLGEVVLEVVGRADAPEQPGTAPGPSRFFGLAVTVRDLDAAVERLGPDTGPITTAVQPGRRIATVRHRQVGMSVALALMSPDPVRRRRR